MKRFRNWIRTRNKRKHNLNSKCFRACARYSCFTPLRNCLEVTQHNRTAGHSRRQNDEKMSRNIGNAQSRTTCFRHSAVLSLLAFLLRKLPAVIQIYASASLFTSLSFLLAFCCRETAFATVFQATENTTAPRNAHTFHEPKVRHRIPTRHQRRPIL